MSMRRIAAAVFACVVALIAASVAAKSRAVRGSAPALGLSATGAGTRFGVNAVVEKQFVPSRVQILIDFLKNGTPPKHSN